MADEKEQSRKNFHDQLSKQLMDCAILVKKGQQSPLLTRTLQDLAEYITASSPLSPGVAAKLSPIRPDAAGSIGGQPLPTNHHQPQPRRPSTASAASEAQSSIQGGSSRRPQDAVVQKNKANAFSVLGKMVGLTGEQEGGPVRSDSSKASTSAKNAQRVKADLQELQQQQQPGQPQSQKKSWFAGHHEENEWCEEHFTMGCSCKTQQPKSGRSETASDSAVRATRSNSPTPSDRSQGGRTYSGASSASTQQPNQPQQQQQAAASSNKPRRAAFQRPTNPKSPLIANGWVEQQRRVRLRNQWKEVLASLVEGRKPGEETTLWIQQEKVSPSNGERSLEALHQIPVKWIQEITYLDFSPDHRFTIKVFNLPDEFQFRCPNNEEAAQNWVLTIRSMQELIQRKHQSIGPGVQPGAGKTELDWGSQSAVAAASSSPRRRAVALEDEKKLPDRQQQQQQEQQPVRRDSQSSEPPPTRPPPQKPHPSTTPTPAASQPTPPPSQQQSTPTPANHGPTPSNASESGPRMTIKELRAIAHGAGISTFGLERGELEEIVAKIALSANGGAPPPQPTAATNAQAPTAPSAAEKEEAERRRKEQQDEAERRRKLEEVRQKQQEEEEAKRKAAADEERKRKEAEEELRRKTAEQVKQQQEAERKKKEDEERVRYEEELRRRDEEEMRRRLAEKQAEEQRRRQEEALRIQQQQWQQQQQQWQQQQAEEEQRRRFAEQQAAEERRRQEEAYRRQQQWYQAGAQQPAQSVPNHHQQPPPPQQQGPQQPPPPWYQQHPSHGPPPQPQGYAVPPPNQQRPTTPAHTGVPPPPPHQPQSPVNMKYAKMAQQTDDDSQMNVHAIKHGILVQWALQPPSYQALRPIEVLLIEINKVFPPNFGVPGHEHFSKWTPLKTEDVSQGPSMGNRPDEEKLKKQVRKLRFFLHPDKLPRDLTPQQVFMCKMLWDITNDAYEEHKKREEDLGWIRGP